MIRWLFAIPLLAGCLSIPPERSADDDGGIDDGGAGDGPLSKCDLAPMQSFRFDQIVNLQIHTAISADLNGDGCEDLIVTHLGTNFGFFVTYGPMANAGPFRYHEFVPTVAQPVSITVADILGSNAPDVLLFGLDNSAGGTESAGLIEIFATGAGALGQQYSDVAELSHTTGFFPGFENNAGDLPISIVVGDFDADGAAIDIAISQLRDLELYLLKGPSFAGVNAQNPVPNPSGGRTEWLDINKLFVVPNPGTGDDLLIVEQEFVTRKIPNSSTLEEYTRDGQSSLIIRTAELYDLDGKPPLDIVGGAGDRFGSYLIDAPTSANFDISNSADRFIDANSVEMWQLSILPTRAGPRLATFERSNGSGEIVHRPLGYSSGVFEEITASTISLSLDPIAAVVADLDHDGAEEYRVISPNGETLCFSPDTENGLVACSP